MEKKQLPNYIQDYSYRCYSQIKTNIWNRLDATKRPRPKENGKIPSTITQKAIKLGHNIYKPRQHQRKHLQGSKRENKQYNERNQQT